MRVPAPAVKHAREISRNNGPPAERQVQTILHIWGCISQVFNWLAIDSWKDFWGRKSARSTEGHFRCAGLMLFKMLLGLGVSDVSLPQLNPQPPEP